MYPFFNPKNLQSNYQVHGIDFLQETLFVSIFNL